jgi:hypothetical protein
VAGAQEGQEVLRHHRRADGVDAEHLGDGIRMERTHALLGLQIRIPVQDAARDDHQIEWAVARGGLRGSTNRPLLRDVDEVVMDVSRALAW